MIHTDGIATVSSSGRPPARHAEVFGVAKPLIVEEAMQREVTADDAKEDLRAMHYGAWRALRRVSESVRAATEPMDASQVLVIIETLEMTYESLYRAAL